MAKNKLAKFAELETFSHVFQVPSRVFMSGGEFEMKGNWNRDFFQNDHPIVLELGCGKGEYTVELARRFPDKNYIGVDIKGARIWTGAKMALEQGLKNVAFIRTNIEMVHHFFAKDEVDEIWLTFPDPQMKKVTKRLTSTGFIQLYLNFLKSESVIHLKTDSNFMFTYTEEMVKANNFTVEEYNTDIYSELELDPILAIKTYYEKQWLERGIDIKYLRFVPEIRSVFIEPDVDIEYDSYRSFKRERRVQ